MINILKTLLIAGGLAYLGLLASAIWITPRALYPAPDISYEMGGPYEFLIGENGQRIAMTYAPLESASELVIFHHGNGEDLGTIQWRLEDFQSRGYAALSYDYPSYGHSDGTPNEAVLYQTAETILQHATKDLGWKPSQIIHYGYSLGSGPAFELGRRHPSRAIVIEGAFKSVFRLYTIVRLLPWEPFNNIAKVDQLQAPLLLIHGTEDPTTPFSHGKALAEAGSEGTRLVVAEGAHHTNVWEVLGDRFWDEFEDFLSANQP